MWRDSLQASRPACLRAQPLIPRLLRSVVPLGLRVSRTHRDCMSGARLSFFDTQNSRKEAVLLAKLKHPNIAAFKESFEAEGHRYIVMKGT
ncbi:Serine/Threonine-Protein Kinase Nek3 [Manis pentadactyla]|nr:Serine/Threonine-Protein Kinase Nek3 [Manis pentadactyla]